MLVYSSYSFSFELACVYCDLHMFVYGSYNFSLEFVYNY